jgi:hypothetical protein
MSQGENQAKIWLSGLKWKEHLRASQWSFAVVFVSALRQKQMLYTDWPLGQNGD